MPETKLDNEILAVAATDALHAFMETMDIAYAKDGGDIIATAHLFRGLFHRWYVELTESHEEPGFAKIIVNLHQGIFDEAAKIYLEGPKSP